MIVQLSQLVYLSWNEIGMINDVDTDWEENNDNRMLKSST